MRSRPSSSLVIVALMLAIGCAPSNPGIIIEGVVDPDDECLFAPGETFRGSVRLDTSPQPVQLRRDGITVRLALQVANQMMNRGSYVYPLMADPNIWFAREAEIEIRGVDGQPLGDLPGLSARFRVPANGGGIPSAGSADDPGRGIVFIDAIPATYGDALATREGEIVLAIRLNGITAGDSSQSTGEFQYTIDLCNGCRIGCFVDDNCISGPAPGSCFPTGSNDAFIPICTPDDIAACMATMPAP